MEYEHSNAFIEASATHGMHLPGPPMSQQRYSITVRRGREIPDKVISIVHKQTLLGRNPQFMINVDDPSVAKEHASIEIIDKKVYLKQISTKRMTRLNGKVLEST